jgi:hypothetical protein
MRNGTSASLTLFSHSSDSMKQHGVGGLESHVVADGLDSAYAADRHEIVATDAPHDDLRRPDRRA